MVAEELIASMKKKSVLELAGTRSRAELALQELDIVNSLKECSSLGDVGVIVDKLIMYVSMSKRLEV